MQGVPEHCEIVIVGGGPVGALAALRLARAGRDVTLIEARAQQAPLHDARALALSWYSREQLAAVGAWPDSLPCTVIDRVHVSQQDGFGRTLLQPEDLDLPHLGVVVDYPALTAALGDALAGAGVRVLWQTRVSSVRSLSRYATLQLTAADGSEALLTSRLVVLAEGGALAETLPGIRRHVHDYQQSALLAMLSPEQPHRHTAYERFSARGPFALLPHGEQMMLVWTRSHEDAQRLQQDGDALLAELQQAFGDRLGRFSAVGERAVFPLALRQLNRVSSGRVVMIGNAAQTMHPVAAQGFNLGLRDAVGLSEILAGAADPGDAAVLRRYGAARRIDSHAVVGFTHGLIRLFDGQHGVVRALRGLGMGGIDVLPPLRKAFASHLVFGVGT